MSKARPQHLCFCCSEASCSTIDMDDANKQVLIILYFHEFAISFAFCDKKLCHSEMADIALRKHGMTTSNSCPSRSHSRQVSQPKREVAPSHHMLTKKASQQRFSGTPKMWQPKCCHCQCLSAKYMLQGSQSVQKQEFPGHPALCRPEFTVHLMSILRRRIQNMSITRIAASTPVASINHCTNMKGIHNSSPSGSGSRIPEKSPREFLQGRCLPSLNASIWLCASLEAASKSCDTAKRHTSCHCYVKIQSGLKNCAGPSFNIGYRKKKNNTTWLLISTLSLQH